MNETTFVVSTHGVKVPRIIYGTAWKAERTAALVGEALALGFRGIDTACQPKHYHELGVGEGIAAAGLARPELYLQTKFTPADGQDPVRMPYDPKASLAEQVAQSFAVSRQNLRTDYVDGLVLHSPLRDEGDQMDVWRAMEAIYDAGGARQLGISNCYAPDRLRSLYEKARIKPAVVQNRFYADTHYDPEIRGFCRQHGIIYQSFWTLTANPRILANRVVTDLAARYGRTPAQVLFRFLTQRDIVPLTGTTSEAHMREDLAIFEFELTEGECEAVERLLQ